MSTCARFTILLTATITVIIATGVAEHFGVTRVVINLLWVMSAACGIALGTTIKDVANERKARRS